MPLVQTRGAASAQGFGEFAQVTAVNYIEDVFSTYLYTGNSSTQTITNDIDLSTYGGLVWLKSRSAANYYELVDSSRALIGQLHSNSDDAPSGNSDVSTFNSNGFSLTFRSGNVNTSGEKEVSWSFRKQPKYFDIQTWTGTGSNRTISHSLGSVPGSIFVKRTDTNGNWAVYHRSLANTQYLVLNTTAAAATGATWWNSTTPTSAVFSVGTDASVNASGGTYVAYVFAHNAGGFGLTGTDNVISCGSFTTDGSGNATVSLGYEPQWVMIKASSTAANWFIFDTMRGMSLTSISPLKPNLSSAENTSTSLDIIPNATGFIAGAGIAPSTSYIYIAIRRGPMKTPTTGTSVYNAVARTGTNADATISGVGFSPDLILGMTRSTSNKSAFVDRLRGIKPTAYLQATATDAESSLTTNMGVTGLTMDGISVDIDNTVGYVNFSTRTYLTHFFKRAPGFFDEVCYKGDGIGATLNHNLTVIPELIINKSRTIAGDWFVYVPSASATYGNLNTTAAFSSLGSQVATASTYDPVSYSNTSTYVSYLFATCAGVSKVGSYTGNGTTQTINCGFTGGARFVMVKATSTTGNWIVADSARGIVAGNDPALYLNSTAAEVTGLDWIDADNSGFVINETATIAANTNGVSYIFLAIA